MPWTKRFWALTADAGNTLEDCALISLGLLGRAMRWCRMRIHLPGTAVSDKWETQDGCCAPLKAAAKLFCTMKTKSHQPILVAQPSDAGRDNLSWLDVPFAAVRLHQCVRWLCARRTTRKMRSRGGHVSPRSQCSAHQGTDIESESVPYPSNLFNT